VHGTRGGRQGCGTGHEVASLGGGLPDPGSDGAGASIGAAAGVAGTTTM
jgi:hypothetical protein